MADIFQPTTARQHYSGGAHEDKTGLALFGSAEMKEKKITGMAKYPQSKAVAGVQKKDDGTMPLNEAVHRNCFHCGSNHH